MADALGGSTPSKGGSSPEAMARSRSEKRPKERDATSGTRRTRSMKVAPSHSSMRMFTRWVGSLSSSGSSRGWKPSQNFSTTPRTTASPSASPPNPSVLMRARVRRMAMRRSLVLPSRAMARLPTSRQSGSWAGTMVSPICCSGLPCDSRSSSWNDGSYSRSAPQGASAETGSNSDSMLGIGMVRPLAWNSVAFTFDSSRKSSAFRPVPRFDAAADRREATSFAACPSRCVVRRRPRFRPAGREAQPSGPIEPSSSPTKLA
jgi:hypothetical protein